MDLANEAAGLCLCMAISLQSQPLDMCVCCCAVVALVAFDFADGNHDGPVVPRWADAIVAGGVVMRQIERSWDEFDSLVIPRLPNCPVSS